MLFGCAGNRHDPWLLCQQPSESHLSRRGLFFISNSFQQFDKRQIGFPVLLKESRYFVSEIVLSKYCILVHFSSEETFSQWTERHESDTEFFQHRKDLFLRLAPPQRVFAL